MTSSAARDWRPRLAREDDIPPLEALIRLAGEPFYASFGYPVGERYAIPMAGGLSLPVVRMSKRLE